jgi:hypothetical protein
MSRLSDVFHSGRVPDVFEQVAGLRLFGISAFFPSAHGFPCFRPNTELRITRNSVFSCFWRLSADIRNFVFFGNTWNSVPHGISCFCPQTEFRITRNSVSSCFRRLPAEFRLLHYSLFAKHGPSWSAFALLSFLAVAALAHPLRPSRLLGPWLIQRL